MRSVGMHFYREHKYLPVAGLFFLMKYRSLNDRLNDRQKNVLKIYDTKLYNEKQ